MTIIIISIILIVLAFKGKPCKVGNRILWIYACIILPLCALILYYWGIPEHILTYKEFSRAIAHDLPIIVFASQVPLITNHIAKKHPDPSQYSIFKNNH